MNEQSGAALMIILVLFVLLTGLVIYDQEQSFLMQHIEINRAHILGGKV